MLILLGLMECVRRKSRALLYGFIITSPVVTGCQISAPDAVRASGSSPSAVEGSSSVSPAHPDSGPDDRNALPPVADDTETLWHPIDDLPGGAPIAIGKSGPGEPSAPSNSDEPLRAPADNNRAIGVELPIDGEDGEVTGARSAVYDDEHADVTVAARGIDVTGMEGVKSGVRSIITVDSALAPSEYEFSSDLPEGTRAESTRSPVLS